MIIRGPCCRSPTFLLRTGRCLSLSLGRRALDVVPLDSESTGGEERKPCVARTDVTRREQSERLLDGRQLLEHREPSRTLLPLEKTMEGSSSALCIAKFPGIF